MKKEDLREVEFTIVNIGSSAVSGKELFHKWRKLTDEEGTETYYAMVEDLISGRIVEIESRFIKFIS